VRVKEVVYSRLFNIGDYSNERIGFKAEVEDGENPEQVIAKLAEKVLIIEECFSLYRSLLKARESYANVVDGKEKELKRRYKRLAELEAERIRLDEEKDERARCRIIPIEDEIKQVLKDIEEIKNELRSYVEKHNDTLRLLREARERILNGEFPESAIEHFKEIDAEAVIKKVEKEIAKLKDEHNIDTDLEDDPDFL